MSCNVWLTAVPAGGHIDDLPVADRRRALDHIRVCSHCREVAVATDSSLVFDSLPRIEISATEIDQIRASVRTLRRTRELGKSISLGRWVGRVAAVAALFLVALLLEPRRPEELVAESPFAGALGVGAGQLDLSQATAPSMDPAGELGTVESEESRVLRLGAQSDRGQEDDCAQEVQEGKEDCARDEVEPAQEQVSGTSPQAVQ
jgi:hypothetical protein